MGEYSWMFEHWHKKRSEELNGREQRSLALQALGGRCIRCGITDVRVLHIDHIISKKDGGLPNLDRHGLYRYIANGGDISNLQLLCANCHMIRHYHEEN